MSEQNWEMEDCHGLSNEPYVDEDPPEVINTKPIAHLVLHKRSGDGIYMMFEENECFFEGDASHQFSKDFDFMIKNGENEELDVVLITKREYNKLKTFYDQNTKVAEYNTLNLEKRTIPKIVFDEDAYYEQKYLSLKDTIYIFKNDDDAESVDVIRYNIKHYEWQIKNNVEMLQEDNKLQLARWKYRLKHCAIYNDNSDIGSAIHYGND